MALNLGALLPLAADATELANIQENIIKSTGRKRSTILFFQVTDQAKARACLRTIAGTMKSALDQFAAVGLLRSGKKSAKLDANVKRATTTMALSHTGYEKLGIEAERTPKDGAFVAHMANRDLGDTASKVKGAFKKRMDGVISVGGNPANPDDDHSPLVDAAVKAIQKTIHKMGGISVVHTEHGRGYENANGEGIEHFGYMDGRSQPLMWEGDVAAEPRRNAGPGFVWDPTFFLNQALIPDPGAADGWGSYFVFRKLEQNVKKFKKAEGKLAEAVQEEAKRLGLPPVPDELPGAMIVGRFEDGTPVVDPIPFGVISESSHNDFDYAQDPSGGKCPFFSHVRKTNPRNEFGGSRAAIMARRGITFGERDQDPVTKKFNDETTKSSGVGLLFMAYMASVEQQFEITQRMWANNPNFLPGKNPGIDPVIGQGAGSRNYNMPLGWGQSQTLNAVGFEECVTFRGGEYFFAPSLSFLRSL